MLFKFSTAGKCVLYENMKLENFVQPVTISSADSGYEISANFCSQNVNRSENTNRKFQKSFLARPKPEDKNQIIVKSIRKFVLCFRLMFAMFVSEIFVKLINTRN